MKIVVGSKLKIEDASSDLKKWCEDNLILDNPDFYKKEKMGKWTGNTPKTICLYEKIGNDLIIPFGCVGNLWRLIGNRCTWEVKISNIRHVNYTSNINPFSYQEKAIQEALKRKNGILVMPCGSGKTQSGLEIIARLGGRALWLTHTQDLLNQSKKRAESVLGKTGLGTITAGKINIGSHITFATVQTLCKVDLNGCKDYWDIIIVDECQHCAGSPTKVTQFYKIMSQLSARYKIGLTATPHRADGLEKSMFCLLGEVIHEVTREEVAHTTCPIKVLKLATNWMPDYNCVLTSDGTIDYGKVIDNMVQDSSRFKLVTGVIGGLDGSALVLANRVKYLQEMCDLIGYGTDAVDNTDAKRCMCISGMSQSKKAKEERKEALRKLNDGELDCLFATYNLAKEGLDVPNLRYVVFATPEKDETTVIQSAGRVGRKADGKEYGKVIDFVDNFGMFQGWAKKRQKFYQKIGAEIDIG